MIGHPVAPPGLPGLPGLSRRTERADESRTQTSKHIGNKDHESRAKARAAETHPPPQADSKTT